MQAVGLLADCFEVFDHAVGAGADDQGALVRVQVVFFLEPVTVVVVVKGFPDRNTGL